MRKKRLLIGCSLVLVLLLTVGCGANAKNTGGNANNVKDVLQQQIDAQNAGSEEAGAAAAAEAETEPQTTVAPPPPEEAEMDLSVTEGVDVDLTLLSGTMLYSRVSYMMSHPEEFIGKTVKVPGIFSVASNQDQTRLYFGCLIADQSACCTLGVEFELPESYSYPEDYPELDSLITVQGTFDTYNENANTYCVLRNATLL